MCQRLEWFNLLWFKFWLPLIKSNQAVRYILKAVGWIVYIETAVRIPSIWILKWLARFSALFFDHRLAQRLKRPLDSVYCARRANGAKNSFARPSSYISALHCPLSSMATQDEPKSDLNLDAVLGELGSGGPFHIRIYCLLMVPVMLFSMYDMTYLFTSAGLDYR